MGALASASADTTTSRFCASSTPTAKALCRTPDAPPTSVADLGSALTACSTPLQNSGRALTASATEAGACDSGSCPEGKLASPGGGVMSSPALALAVRLATNHHADRVVLFAC